MDVWEVLFHVLNHAADHRAQTLAPLYAPGARTFPQDYAFFVMGKLQPHAASPYHTQTHL